MPDKKNEENWTGYLQLGLELSSYVIVFFFAGYFIDFYFETKPYFTVFGALFGILSVFYVLWKRFLK
ncbi:MAG: AtpZ/AtpI family protein [Elusimicrobiales bacterium]|nr:AtpZ/AtpI family protein [Elusimicrobiales bacterium]